MYRECMTVVWQRWKPGVARPGRPATAPYPLMSAVGSLNSSAGSSGFPNKSLAGSWSRRFFGIQVLHLQLDSCHLSIPQGQHPPASQVRREKGEKFRLKHKDANPQTCSHWRQACICQRTDCGWLGDGHDRGKGRQGGNCNLSGKGKLFYAHGKTQFGKAGRPTGACRRKATQKERAARKDHNHGQRNGVCSTWNHRKGVGHHGLSKPADMINDKIV